MADESFAVHQYLPSQFRVGEPESTGVYVVRTNRTEGLVTLSLSEGPFHWHSGLTVAQAGELGQALLFAASDAAAGEPVTESLGQMQLMVRWGTGGLFDVAKGGAA